VGNFHARGFDGNDKMDHCAHIGLMRDVMKSWLKKRWNSPKGLGPKKGKADDGDAQSKQKPKEPKEPKKLTATNPKKSGGERRPTDEPKTKKTAKKTSKKAI
jgi:hypothetical protein